MTATTITQRFRPGRRSEFALDTALAAVALAATLMILQHGGVGGTSDVRPRLDTLAVLLAAVASLPLVAWRRAPLVVLSTTMAASVVLQALGYPGAPPIGATIALYLLASSRDEAHMWTRATTALVVVMFLAHITAFGIGHGKVPGVQLAIAALVWALAWFAGDRTRLRRQQLHELKLRARTAEREAERDRRLAVAEERARIARDLHDSAAHAINVIAVQAGAARLLSSTDPQRAKDALRTVEEVARETVADIDTIVHSLREDGPRQHQVELAPGLAAFGTLVAQHRAAGLSVSVETDGKPRSLGAGADQGAYRILQEALTNAARHGAGTAEVALTYGPEALGLTISNPVSADGPSRNNGCHGIVGMRERAGLLGGELSAQRTAGVFTVRARIPYAAAGPA